MLHEYTTKVGLVDNNGNAVEKTESEMNLLASEASSTVFRREQNRNDNKDQNRKFVKIYGDEVKNCMAFY